MSINNKPTLALLVTQSDLGGAQQYVLAIGKTAREYFRVVVAAGPDGGGALLREAASAGLETRQLVHLRRAIRPWQDARAFLEWRRFIREIQPDIVHANSTKAGVIAALASIGLSKKPKQIYTAHGWVFLEPLSTWLRFVYQMMERLAGYFRDITIVLSDVEKNAAIAARVAVSKKIRVIPNGVSLRSHDRAAARTELERAGIPRDAIVIGCLANFYPVKNLPALVRAFREVAQDDPRLHLALIGDGEERPTIEIARQNHARVHLLGYRNDARALLDGFDLFILPSLKEGLPFALLEAMEASLPCAAANVGGIPAIITHKKNGFLFSPDDVAAGLGAALDSYASWPAIASAARQTILTSFTEERMTKETLDIYASFQC